MKRAHLTIQAAVLAAVVSFVAWPDFRPVRARSIWRYTPDTVLQARTIDASRFAEPTNRRSREISSDDKAFPVSTPDSVTGVARTSLNAAIPYAHVALRDLRSGELAAHTIADSTGEFHFVHVDGNIYLIELIGPDGAVVGISGIVDTAAQRMRIADVRAASSAAAVRASLADTLVPTAPQATRAAADTGVTRTTPSEIPQVSPR